jgi:signal transduction histidine kinase
MEKGTQGCYSRILVAEEKEAKRIARELHHDLSQVLSSIESRLENAIRQIAGNEVKTGVESLRSLIPKIQSSISELQRIGMHMFPPTLGDLGILATISWACREFQKANSGIQIAEQIDIQENEIPGFLKIIIYKILGEALSNIANHSNSDLVHLSFQKKNGRIELTIQDNGKGFNVGEVLNKESGEEALGLSSLRDRVELSGGSFSIESSKGRGTVIRALWPIEQPRH